MSFKDLSSLLPTIKKYSLHLLLTFCGLITSSYCILKGAQEIRNIIDIGIIQSNIQCLYISGGKLLAIALILTIASFIRLYGTSFVANNIIYDIRIKTYRHLLSLNIHECMNFATSKAQSMIIDNAASINMIFRELFSFLLRNLIICCSAGYLMFYYSKILTLLIAGFIIVVCCIAKIFIFFSKALAFNNNQSAEKISSLAIQTITNIKLIHGYNLESWSMQQFLHSCDQLLNLTLRTTIKRALFIVSIIFIICLGVISIVLFSATEVIRQHINTNHLVSFIIYASMFIVSLIGILNNLSAIRPEYDKLLVLLHFLREQKDAIKLTQNSPNINNFNINFNNIEFCYPDSKHPVFSNFTQHIKQGECIAISGKSGSGKTSLINLLLKFYTISNGSIQIDNRCINDLSNNFVRSNISFVNQDPLLFDISILENILLGRSHNPEELDQIINICRLQEVLNKMPKGLASYVGLAGANLSGGEKQRICIARALIGRPNVLVLDEATNALDEESEEHILNSIKNYMQGQTIIFISHKSKVLNLANRIIYLDH